MKNQSFIFNSLLIQRFYMVSLLLAIFSLFNPCYGASYNPKVLKVGIKTECVPETPKEYWGATVQLVEGEEAFIKGDAKFHDGTQSRVNAQWQILRESDNVVVNTGTVRSDVPWNVTWDTEKMKEGWYRTQAKATLNNNWVNGPRVYIYDVRQGTIHSQRVSAPTESLFKIKSGEHYEVGGTFKFQLVRNAGITPPGAPKCLKYSLEDTDGINDVLQKGTGIDFQYTFKTGVDEGDCYVYFYFDHDGDDSWSWFDEPHLDSDEFWVMKRKVYNFSVQYSDAIIGGPGDINARFASAAEIVIKKDSDDDWRGCVQFTVSSLNPFVHTTASTLANARNDPLLVWPVPTTPPALVTEYWQNVNNHISQADVVFLNSLLTGATGVTYGMTWHDILLDYSASDFRTLAHEISHGVGLSDIYGVLDSRYVTYGYEGGARILLKENEDSAFDDGP